MTFPFVSIIMPIRNEATYIVGCLTAVFEQDYPADRMEILIADGMSNDNTRNIIQTISDECQIPITIIDNPGKIVPVGMNLAIRQSKGDIIIRVDGHCNIAPDYVRRCVDVLNRTHADNAGGLMSAIGSNAFGEAVALGTSTPFGIGGGRFHYSDKEEWVDTVYMGAWPRRVFERIGLFDEEMVRNQDDEFNYRLRKAGGKIFLSPKIQSKYMVRSTLGGLWRQYYQYGNWKVRVLQKLPGQMSPRQYAPPAFVLALIASVFLALLPVAQFLAPIIPLLYLFTNLSASAFTASKNGWRYYPLLPFVFATLHLSYGLGFLVGLFRFWNRWGDKVGKVREFAPAGIVQPKVGFALAQVSSASVVSTPMTSFERFLLSGNRHASSVPAIMPQKSYAFKRLFDLLASSFGLFFLSPLFLFAGVLIKRDSPGPVFFRCLRAGKNGKQFLILKFRTMKDSAEAEEGPSITAQDDPRITPFGRWLRVTKLNELPQLWNVLTGEMSLVGPRPEDPEIVSIWPEEVRQLVLSIRPGMTSPASVVYRNEEELLNGELLMDEYLNNILPDKLRLDELYLHNNNLVTDLDVIFWTLIGLLPRIKHTSIPENTLFWGPLSSLVNRYFTWFAADICVALAAVGISGGVWRLGEVINLGIWLDIGVAIVIALLFSLINYSLGLGRVSWRHARPAYTFDLAFSSGLTTSILFALDWFWRPTPLLPRGMILITGLLAFLGFTVLRYRERLITGMATRWVINRSRAGTIGERVLIVGAGECGQMAAWLLQKSNLSPALSVIGMVDDDPSKYKMRIDGQTVIGRIRDIPDLVRDKNIGVILYAISNVSQSRQEQILKTCRALPVRLVIIPDLMKIVHDYLIQPNVVETSGSSMV